MNVLIITPDAVGSTLLQRLITIYMQFHDFDKPVINLHELTNGIEKYYSPEFGREIVSKSRVKNWGYYQSLEDVVKILSEVDHYKTSRLAQYHIKNRNDPINQQIPFYRYLDENFFVIACRRHNIFEHALSMAINNITKKLNVYNHNEKINAFIDMYLEPIQIDEQVFVNQLESYQNYLAWSTNHFNISSFFHYDQNLENIEKYIFDLPIWPRGQPRVTWKEKFGIDFNDWNRCHHIPSDLSIINQMDSQDRGLITQQAPQDPVGFYQENALPEWPAVHCIEDLHTLPDTIKTLWQEMQNSAADRNIACLQPELAQKFMQQNLQGYQNAESAIARMQELDIIVSPPPIKKQTLQEKIAMVRNADRCLDIFNDWAQHNGHESSVLSPESINEQIQSETNFWKPFMSLTDSQSGQQPIEKLIYQNDDDL
jgi:hypothetical protein